jgi:hypothetical protein
VALYTRVSTVEQAVAGYSIDEQEKLLRDYYDKEAQAVKRVRRPS